MAMVLLDHPWPLKEALHAENEAFEVLERFDRLIKERKSLLPIPFVDTGQYEVFCEELGRDGITRATGRHLISLIDTYVSYQEDGRNVTASPDPEPRGIPLPQAWKRSLYRALGDLRDWRNPQIVVARKRADCWPRKALETMIKMDERVVGTYVLAGLEEYATHPFAISDFDPWDLQRCHQTATEGRMADYRCCLPKHPALDGASFEQLRMKLMQIRTQGWHYRVGERDRYCYIPSGNWDPTVFEKDDWRMCRTFPQGDAGGNRGRGPVDYEERVWIWDRTGKRHWDVQFPVKNPEDNPEYWVISHTGERLRES